jgi:hypothetical protein
MHVLCEIMHAGVYHAWHPQPSCRGHHARSVLYIAAKSAPACGALILCVRVLILSSSARENNGLALSE